MITIIVAHDENYCIGNNNNLMWHIPEDLKHFQNYTKNKKIVMGRKTFESIGHPLPNRFTYIISSNKNYLCEIDSVEICTDINSLISLYKDSDEELIVCGGGTIYELFLPYTDKLVVSLIKGKYDGDTYFPSYYINDFKLKNKKSLNNFDIIIYLKE